MIYGNNCKWIAADPEDQNPVFIKKFVCKPKSNACITISALGFFELRINGRTVGNEKYRQVWSNYAPRDFTDFLYPITDSMSYTIYARQYDITEYLTDGENRLTVMLGNGWYRQTERRVEGSMAYGDRLGLIYSIRIDGEETVVSDGSEILTEGFIPYNNIYFGETQDFTRYRAEDSDVWSDKQMLRRADSIPAPEAVIRLQECACDTEVKRICCIPLSNGIWDAGENISGFVTLKAKNDGNITVRYFEELTADGFPDYRSAGGEEQIGTDRYLYVKCGQTLAPVFSCHGFRYVQIEGEAAEVQAVFVSCVRETAEFHCNNQTLNRLYETYIRTQLSNIHYGVPSDCPHRERLGYTGDGQLISDVAMLTTDSRALFEKWMRDIADSQDPITGHVQHTAPFYGGGGGPGGWGSAVVIVLYRHMQHYGDKKFVRTYYPNCLKWVNSMVGFCDGGLVVRESEGGWCLGDWCTPEENKLPEPYVNTCLFVRALHMLAELGDFIGETSDFSELEDRAKTAVFAKYFDAAKGSFCDGVQGANLFAIAAGWGDDSLAEKTLTNYERSPHINTGILGTELLFDFLAEQNRVDLIVKLLSDHEFPSFGYMLDHGATTLWEYWDGNESHNHPMFGACVKHLFYSILGVKQKGYGFRRIILHPQKIEGIESVSGVLRLGDDVLKIAYTFSDKTITVETEFGQTLEVFLNGKEKKLPAGYAKTLIEDEVN